MTSAGSSTRQIQSRVLLGARNGERGGIIFRLIILLVFAALLFVVYLVRRPILTAVGEYWIVDDPASQADALIVLSDDDFVGSRAAKAADLYHEGRAPHIVASGRMLRPYAGIGELIQRDLTDRGVPTSAIEIYRHNASDTLDEAQTLRGLVVAKKWKHVVIVTSNYHTRRARYIYQKVFPLGVQVDVASPKIRNLMSPIGGNTKTGLRRFLKELARNV